MIKELIKLATHLDKIGLRKEANYLDNIIKNNSNRNYKKAQQSPQPIELGIIGGSWMFNTPGVSTERLNTKSEVVARLKVMAPGDPAKYTFNSVYSEGHEGWVATTVSELITILNQRANLWS